MKVIYFDLNPEFDGVEIRVKGNDYEHVWQEGHWGYIDQWLRHHAPLGEPVILMVKGDQ